MSDHAEILSPTFNDIYIKGNISEIKDSFDPKYVLNLESLQPQSFQTLAKHEVISYIETDSEEEVRIFRVLVKYGIRWLAYGDDAETPETVKKPSDLQKFVQAKIEADFNIEYSLDDELDQEALVEFAQNNAIVDSWPYWCEFLTSQVQRLQLSGVQLPPKRVSF